jgi:hypothetical protein
MPRVFEFAGVDRQGFFGSKRYFGGTEQTYEGKLFHKVFDVDIDP